MNCAVSHGLRTRRALWLRTQRIPHGMLAQPIACPFPPSSHPVIQGPVSQGVRGVRGSSTWKEDNSHLFQRENTMLLSPGCVKCKEGCCMPGSGSQDLRCIRGLRRREAAAVCWGCRCQEGQEALRTFMVDSQVNDRS